MGSEYITLVDYSGQQTEFVLLLEVYAQIKVLSVQFMLQYVVIW